MTIADRLKNLYDSMVIANSVTNEFVEALPDCYEAVEEKGGTIPAQQTAANLPTAIASIPSGGEDLSWWADCVSSYVYAAASQVGGTEYMLGSPFLRKNASDIIVYEKNTALGDGYNSILSTSSRKLIFNTYNPDTYAKTDYWTETHSGTTLGNATMFRIFIPRNNAKMVKIYNQTTGEIYWKGSEFDTVAVNALTKEELLKIIQVEISPSTTLFLSADNYNLYSSDSDVVAALTDNPNLTLASV